MRWDKLFDDLESQLEQGLTAEEIDLQAEEERLRLARLDIRDRLHAVHLAGAGEAMRMLHLILRDGSRVTVLPSSFGRDWLSGELVDGSGVRSGCVIPIDAVGGMVLTRAQLRLSFETARVERPSDALSERLGLPFILRDLCRRRQPVELHLGESRLHGTIDRVGRDHLDLAVHEAAQPRRESAVTEYRIVRFTQILFVRH